MSTIYIAAAMDSSGYGEAARNNIAALSFVGEDISVVPVSFEGRKTNHGKLGNIVRSLIKQNPNGDIQILHVTPHHYEKLVRKDRYNIAYMAWETSKLSSQWVDWVNLVDEIWVPSQHNKIALKESGVKKPIYVIPHTFDFSETNDNQSFTIQNTGEEFIFYSIFQWCYDDQTRVLTKKGFKFFKELNDDDELATLNKDSEKLEYQKPQKIVSFYRKGKMLKMENQAFNFCVTPDHRMLVRDYRDRNWKLIPANKLINKKNGKFFSKWRTKKDCIWNGKTTQYFYPPKISQKQGKNVSIEKIKIEYFLQLLGWYLSEGSIDINSRGYYIEISQHKNKKNIQEIENCIKKCGFSPFRVTGGWRFSSKQMALYFKQFGSSYEKFIPLWVKALEERLLLILLSSLWKGNGRYNKQGEKSSYVTSSKQLAEDVLECLIKTKYSGSISFAHPKNTIIHEKLGSRIIEGKRNIYTVSVNKKQNEPSLYYGNPEYIDYDNYIYCVSVPNETLLVERKGKVLWAGNTERKNPFGLLKAYLTEFKPDEKVCLVLKTFRVTAGDPSDTNFIKQEINSIKQGFYLKSFPKLLLISNLFSSAQMRTLHTEGDCYISLLRSEGWGIPITEAMIAGNPVITTGYSGPADFVTEETGYPVDYIMTPVHGMPWEAYQGDQLWAEPDIMHARKLMRYVFENQKEAKKKGEIAQKWVKENLNYDKVGSLMKDRLAEIRKLRS